MAEDPVIGRGLDESAAWYVAISYMNWVECARFLTEIPIQELFGVLDAADDWLTATGHRDWRAGIVLQRALLHKRLGDLNSAIVYAGEALAAYRPGVPSHNLASHRSQLAAMLRDAGRHRDAEPHYRAILDSPAADSYDRKVAYQGLARCALDAGDTATGRRHATAAVRIADPLGDDALCPALEALVAVYRADGDLNAAWQAATRLLEAAARVGGHYRPYYATRDAVDVALDRDDLDTARRLLNELDTHATAMDTAHGNTTYTNKAAQRRRRLEELS
jgi:tetratricopeptide (TPR) repeat protein